MNTLTGPGRVLVFCYGIFALAATARASVQILSRWDEAPLAFALSAVAAVIYLIATFLLARNTPRTRCGAWIALSIEFAAVVGVGILSFVKPHLFPQPSVWSHLGQGYGYLPLVLPLLGMWWLRHEAGPPEVQANS